MGLVQKTLNDWVLAVFKVYILSICKRGKDYKSKSLPRTAIEFQEFPFPTPILCSQEMPPPDVLILILPSSDAGKKPTLFTLMKLIDKFRLSVSCSVRSASLGAVMEYLHPKGK